MASMLASMLPFLPSVPSLIIYGTAAKKTVDALLWAHALTVRGRGLVEWVYGSPFGLNLSPFGLNLSPFGLNLPSEQEEGFQWVDVPNEKSTGPP